MSLFLKLTNIVAISLLFCACDSSTISQTEEISDVTLPETTIEPETHTPSPSRPNDQSRPSEESIPNDQTTPSEESTPNDQSRPSEESTPNDQSRPSEESIPNDQSRPSEESIPNDQTTPSEESTANESTSVQCSGTDKGFEKATLIHKGKQIQGLTTDTRIRIWHIKNNTVKFCVITGKVEII